MDEDSILPDLIRLKLPHLNTPGEVITTVSILRTKFEQENLGLTARDVEKLIRNLKAKRLKSLDISGFIIYEQEYRVFRELGLHSLLW